MPVANMPVADLWKLGWECQNFAMGTALKGGEFGTLFARHVKGFEGLRQVSHMCGSARFALMATGLIRDIGGDFLTDASYLPAGPRGGSVSVAAEKHGWRATNLAVSLFYLQCYYQIFTPKAGRFVEASLYTSFATTATISVFNNASNEGPKKGHAIATWAFMIYQVSNYMGVQKLGGVIPLWQFGMVTGVANAFTNYQVNGIPGLGK